VNKYTLKAANAMYYYGGVYLSVLWSGALSMSLAILLSYYLRMQKMPLWFCISPTLLFPLGVGTGACIGYFITRSTAGDRTKVLVILSFVYLLLFIIVGMVWMEAFGVFPWKTVFSLMACSVIFCSLSKILYPIYNAEYKESDADKPVNHN